MAKKKDLGRGIRALLNDIDRTPPPVKKKVVNELASRIEEIELDSIETNPYQPRIEFDEQQLEELANSIKLHGLVQPITVRSLGEGAFQLISGERRLRAAKIADLKSIPAYIRIANDQEMLEFALIENIQRQNLNAMEVALSYKRLMDECNLTQEKLSERVGKRRSTVANYIRLLKLPPEIQQAVKRENISMGHARVLAGINETSKQLSLFRKCVSLSWSVRKLEDEARAEQFEETEKKQLADYPELKKYMQQLQKKFGVTVGIKRNSKGKGSITIPFNDEDEFNNLMDTLGA